MVAAAVRRDVPFRAAGLVLPIESPIVDELLDAAQATARDAGRDEDPLLRLAHLRDADPAAGRGTTDQAVDDDDLDVAIERDGIAASLLAWAAGCRDLDELRGRIEATRARLAALRSDDARLLLATAHGTKGLEFDHVAVIGLDDGRFPSARSVSEALEPDRALEEERRLAYVAWTRTRRSLTLVYDPGSPSQFLLEAFTAAELRLPPWLARKGGSGSAP